MDANVLAEEVATYAAQKESLVQHSLGKYVVISGDKVLGTWDTYEEALEAGYTNVGLKPFLVREVRLVDEVWFF